MQNDDVIWSLIGNKRFCRYKVKTRRQQETFCLNEYNVTGLCSRQSCPLANSRYATIREETDGKLCLYLKSIERAHLPRKLWQKVHLSGSYPKALAQIDRYLAMWPKFLVHRAKQRLTKLIQYRIRKQRLDAVAKTQLLPVKKKVERREQKREQRALDAAKLTMTIERELLERLKQGRYGEIFNFAQKEFEHVMEQEAEPVAYERDLEGGYYIPADEQSEEGTDEDFAEDDAFKEEFDDHKGSLNDDESASDDSALVATWYESGSEEDSIPDLEDLPRASDNGAGPFYFDNDSDAQDEAPSATRIDKQQLRRLARTPAKQRKRKQHTPRQQRRSEQEFEFEQELERL
jgi:protein MAK16